MKNNFLFVCFIFLCSNSYANTNLDSLWSLWNNESETDTIRAEALYNYARDAYLYSNPDSTYYYAEILYAFSNKNGLKKEMGRALNLQGISFQMRSDFINALNYYNKALGILDINNDPKGLNWCYQNVGNVYSQQGNYIKAVQFYKKCMEVSEISNNKEGIAGASYNIGYVYSQQKDMRNAIDYYQRGINLFKETSNKRGIIHGQLFKAKILAEQKEYKNALDLLNQGLDICREISDKRSESKIFGSIGEIYFKQNEHEKALNYYKKGLDVAEKIGDKILMSQLLFSIGKLYNQIEIPKKAIQYCTKSLSLAEEIGLLEVQKNGCDCLYQAYKNIGKRNLALEFHEKLTSLEDSLNTGETTKKLQQMEFEKQVLEDSIAQVEKERLVQVVHEEEVQKNNKIKNILLGSGLLLLLLAGGLFTRNRYIKKSKDLIEKEKDRSENLLLNILPAEIAEELKEKGEAAARDFDLVSILFTDFKGFTEAAEKLSAADLVNEINVCFKAFDAICGKYKVEKIKTIGDAYMAAGGLPVPADDSVKNTILAALEMQTFISNRKKEKDAKGEPAFEMRVGIHTGAVVAGIVGVKKFQYDIWGDTVNTASRIESEGEVGKVNISQSTFDLLKDDAQFTFESRGKIEAKGKGEMEMYFVNPGLSLKD